MSDDSKPDIRDINRKPPSVSFTPETDLLIWLVESRQRDESVSDVINRKLQTARDIEHIPPSPTADDQEDPPSI